MSTNNVANKVIALYNRIIHSLKMLFFPIMRLRTNMLKGNSFPDLYRIFGTGLPYSADLRYDEGICIVKVAIPLSMLYPGGMASLVNNKCYTNINLWYTIGNSKCDLLIISAVLITNTL